MAFFRQKDVADFKGIMKSFPDFGRPSALLHEAVMRAASQFSLGERELIAAYTSALNACDYCVAEHSALAESFGIAPGLLEQLQADIDTAPVSDKIKPVLRFVRKLTLTPGRLTQQDADAVFAAGWNDDSLFLATAVAALFDIRGFVTTPRRQVIASLLCRCARALRKRPEPGPDQFEAAWPSTESRLARFALA